MAGELKDVEAEKKGRHRSPNYPGIGLRSAVAKIEAIYKADGLAAAPQSAILKHLGYDKLHGEAGRMLSALKSFGLIEEVGDRIKITHRGINIVARPDGDPTRAEALRSAALSPNIYREIANDYKTTGGLPSDTTLKAELIAVKRFNPNAVDEFVRDFRDSIRFAGLSDARLVKSEKEQDGNKTSAHHVSLPKVGDYVQWESQGQLQFPESKRVRAISEDGAWLFVDGSETGISVKEAIMDAPITESPEVKPPVPPTMQLPSQPAAGGGPGRVAQLLVQTLVISIPRDFKVDIGVRGDELKKEDLAKIKSQFNRWIEGLEEAF